MTARSMIKVVLVLLAATRLRPAVTSSSVTVLIDAIGPAAAAKKAERSVTPNATGVLPDAAIWLYVCSSTSAISDAVVSTWLALPSR